MKLYELFHRIKRINSVEAGAGRRQRESERDRETETDRQKQRQRQTINVVSNIVR